MLPRRAGAAALPDEGEVLLLGRVGRDERREDRDDDNAAEDHEPGDRARVAAQPQPRVGPETSAARLLERDFPGFELGDAHFESLIRGFSTPYERSTSRLTKTTMTATKRT